MSENIELSKVRVLATHLQSNINVTYSLIFGAFISFSMAIVSFTLQTMDLRILGVLPLSFIAFWGITQFQVKRYQYRNLQYIDELLEKIENGEKLPSMNELERILYKR